MTQETNATNVTPTPSPAIAATRSKAPLYWVLAVCIAPTVAAFVAYYGWNWEANTETTNYGELLTAQPTVPALPSAKTLDGKPFEMQQLAKKWVYATVDGGACLQACADRLFNTRQQKAMTGRERDRVARVFFVTDAAPIAPELQSAHPDLTIVRVTPSELAFLVPPQSAAQTDTIWIIDPLGRVMMRYPNDPNPSKMKRDLSKLLYASKGWQNSQK